MTTTIKRRRAAGLCPTCGRQEGTETSRCNACLAKQLKLNRIRRRSLQKLGICARCGAKEAES